MKATPFLLSVLAAGYAAADVTLTERITDTLTIDDGQTYTLTHQVKADTAPQDTSKALDLDSGTVTVTGTGSRLDVTTNGGFNLASGGGSDEATLKAEAGGVIELTSTAKSNSKAAPDEWYKFRIASSSEEGAEPVANIVADGEGSQINIHFGAFTGAYGDYNDDGTLNPTPNRGGVYFGAEVPPGYTREGMGGTVNLTASNGGSISFDDQGKSSWGGFLEVWSEQTNVTLTEGSSLSVNAMFRTVGTVNYDISGGSTATFGYNYYSQINGGRTIAVVDGTDSLLHIKGSYASIGKDNLSVTNGGQIQVDGYVYGLSGSGGQAFMDISVDGTGSKFSVKNSTYGYYNYSATTTIKVTGGGSAEMPILWNNQNTALPYYVSTVDIAVSGTDAEGNASSFVNTGHTLNYRVFILRAGEGGTASLAGQLYNTTTGTGTLQAEGGRVALGSIANYGELSLAVADGGMLETSLYDNAGSCTFSADGAESSVTLGSCNNYAETGISATNGGVVQLGAYEDVTEWVDEENIYTYTPQTTITLTNGGRLVLGTPAAAKIKATGTPSSFNGAIFYIDGSSEVQSFSDVTFTDSTFNINVGSSGKPAIVIEDGAVLNWGMGTKPNQVNLTIAPELLAGDSTEFEIVIVDGLTNYEEAPENVIVNPGEGIDGGSVKLEQKTAELDGADALVMRGALSKEGVEMAKTAFSAAGTGVANALHSSVSAVLGIGAAALNQLHYRPVTDSRFWVQGLGDFVRAGGHGAAPGYHYNGGGYAVGYDHAVAERLVLGAAFGQQFGVNKTRVEETRVRQHATMGTLYGRYSYDCPRGCITRVVDGYASYGSVRNRGRSVLLGERATGRWDDDVFNLGFRFGWQVPLNAQKSWTLTPFIGLEYSYGSQGDAHLVSENYERRYHDGSMQVWSIPVGATLQGRYAVSGTRYLLPELTLAYVGDVARRDPRVKAAVLGEETVYEGTEPGRHALRLQVGTRYTLTENITTGLFYSLDYRARDCEQSVDASISVSF